MPIDFDGTDDLINAGSDSSIQISTFTYSAFVKTSTAAYRDIIGWSATSGGPLFRVDNDHKLSLLEQAVANIGTSTGTISTSAWSHVAVTYDSSGNYAFYIDGAASGSGTNLRTLTFSTLYIGKQAADTSELFDGQIDDLRIYNRELTAAEIANIGLARNRRLGGQSANGLVLHYELTEGTPETSADGDTIPDRSGSGNDGTGDDGANNTGLTWKASTHLSRSAA